MVIQQAVAKVVEKDRGHHWIRISRRKLVSLANYYRSQPNFYYLKIYEIRNYHRLNTKKGIKHDIGKQIGFITLTSSDYNENGVFDSVQSQQFKQKFIK